MHSNLILFLPLCDAACSWVVFLHAALSSVLPYLPLSFPSPRASALLTKLPSFPAICAAVGEVYMGRGGHVLGERGPAILWERNVCPTAHNLSYTPPPLHAHKLSGETGRQGGAVGQEATGQWSSPHRGAVWVRH